MNFSLVLDDDILIEFEKFKKSLEFDKNIIENMLKYYKPTHLINLNQISKLENLNLAIDHDLKAIFIQSGYANLTLEELSRKTILKIILTNEKSKSFPYLYIKDEKIENNICSTFKKRESRNKAFEYFKNLFLEANSIFIYDNHLTSNNLINFINICSIDKDIYLPRDIYNKINANNQMIKIDRQNHHYSGCHDRYILIYYPTYKIELILTSGIDYLLDTTKDFTYIVRVITSSIS
ncbi:TPA: hypothetical protein ACHD36_001310 [Campylobacter jejuni]|uniref:hypothetical protein n=1 Tax=Campylobacter sp. US42a TaxID=2498121 RepID=UPI0010678652|nr:hypothetical protein [Campylobacter sp. US42a]EAI3890363.1 hypothetical protein [Campylobacter jejuni]EAI4335722.1 hypothetical protein [Campylobacter jejuni]EAI4349437.1 hypothetical protein [Campylobacter jejuni]EAJ9404155.1 hypothetical protein [Campylobacter jejuni]EAK0368700.1 hypothetical protein [Campylobacter jejuni]